MMQSSKWRVTTFVGTRPEIIRLSEIIKLADTVFDHRLIHSGQNSVDYLNEVFFKELEIPHPDEVFETDNSSLGNFLGTFLPNAERELTDNRPDGIMILGDTNTALVSIIARRLNIPVFHLEAGNRSFDSNVPEEINRRIVDHSSDYNLAYSEHARRNLLDEGLHPRTVFVIGSPLNEVLKKNYNHVLESRVLEELNLENQNYYLVSMHRQENVNSKDRLLALIEALEAVAQASGKKVVVSLHPRTNDKLQKFGIECSKNILLVSPFGFHDYVALQQNAIVVLSDSGSISEEAAILGFKAITIRNSMERPEALETGVVVLAGTEPRSILRAIEGFEGIDQESKGPVDYQVIDTSKRVISIVLSILPNHKDWAGIR